MPDWAAGAAGDSQRSERSKPAVGTPASMAHRSAGAVVQTPLGSARGIAPGQLQYLQRTLGNHRLGELLRRAYGMGSPVEQLARPQVQARLSQDFSTVLAQPRQITVSRSPAETSATSPGGADAADSQPRTESAEPSVPAAGTALGQRALARELARAAPRSRAGTPLLQRQPKPATEPWLTQVDDILPRKVGLLAHMHRIGQLTDRFTTNQLNELIGLIHASADATSFTRDEAGVPGIFALQDTRIGSRLDVAAARFLLKTFPARRATPRKSDDTKAEVFSEEVVRDAYIRFHYNAILPGKDDLAPPDLPKEIRQNCIAIIHDLAPKLFTDESVVKRIEKRF